MSERDEAIASAVMDALVRRAGRTPAVPRGGTHLAHDWWLHGAGLLDVAEDLAGHLTHELDAEDLIDLVIGGYWLDDLLRLVTERWAEGNDAA